MQRAFQKRPTRSLFTQERKVAGIKEISADPVTSDQEMDVYDEEEEVFPVKNRSKRKLSCLY